MKEKTITIAVNYHWIKEFFGHHNHHHEIVFLVLWWCAFSFYRMVFLLFKTITSWKVISEITEVNRSLSLSNRDLYILDWSSFFSFSSHGTNEKRKWRETTRWGKRLNRFILTRWWFGFLFVFYRWEDDYGNN